MDELTKNISTGRPTVNPIRSGNEKWLHDYWKGQWDNQPDKGFYPQGPGSFDPKGRYQGYVDQTKNPFYGEQGNPLSYKDWMRMQRWQHGTRDKGGYSTADLKEQDNPEYWRSKPSGKRPIRR